MKRRTFFSAIAATIAAACGVKAAQPQVRAGTGHLMLTLPQSWQAMQGELIYPYYEMQTHTWLDVLPNGLEFERCRAAIYLVESHNGVEHRTEVDPTTLRPKTKPSRSRHSLDIQGGTLTRRRRCNTHLMRAGSQATSRNVRRCTTEVMKS